MKKIRLFLTGLLLMMGTAAFAQDITVTGTVTDASTGEGIYGVTVLLQGDNTKYASTDDMGAYSITVPADGVLEVRFMGYTTQEIPVNGRSIIDVEMEIESEMLDDVIVVGYGSARKISSVVGSASTVNKKVIANRPTANAADALQGQVSGLQVFTSSGEPSETATMRLRGVSSINASTTPLFILDGSPVSADVFSSLNSNDIENIVVMKDASSTAIYGSRAANGVIYITTKKGAIGEKPVVSLRAQYGVSQMTNHRMNLMNADQWFEFQNLVNPDFQMTEYQSISQNLGINTNWVDYYFKEAAPIWSLDASVSGASERTDYYISLGAFDQEGIAFDSNLSRYNIRTNVNTKVSDWLRMGMNVGLSYQEYQTTPYMSNGQNSYGNIMFASNNLPAWLSPYAVKTDDAGNHYVDYSDELKYFDPVQQWNAYYLSDIQPIMYTIARLNASTYQQITPIKGLTLRAQQSVEAYDWRASQKALPVADDEWPFTGSEPNAAEAFERYYRLTFTNTAEYRFSVAERNNFAVLLGQEAILTDDESFSASSYGQSDLRQPYLPYGTDADMPSWGKSEINYNSYFARVSYDYDSKYFIDASWRLDGSSLFGVNKKYANFYSVGAMWDLKREEWMQGVSWIQDLRLKASYGTTGNSGISNYLSYGTVGAYSSRYDNGGLAWGVGTPPNPDLTWETVETLNIGVTARLWNFMGVSVEFYNKMTRDMLMDIPYSYTTGYASGAGNIADMYNRGVDVDLSFDVIQTRDVYFNIKANFNYNQNRITSLFDGVDYYTIANTGLRMEVGHAWGEYYYVRSAGVDPRDGMQMWYDKNGNKTKVYSEEDQVMTGKQRYAPWAGGIQLNFQYKGLYVGADFTWVAGNWILNNDKWFLTNPVDFPLYNMTTDMLNIWTHPGQETDIPSLESTRQFDDSYLENASFLRLKNLQIGYSFPQHWMDKTGFLAGARIYAIARNLFTITQYSGYDPEVDSNIQMGVYPNTREFSIGVELTF